MEGKSTGTENQVVVWQMWEGSEREWFAFFCSSVTQLLRKKIEGCSGGTDRRPGNTHKNDFFGFEDMALLGRKK